MIGFKDTLVNTVKLQPCQIFLFNPGVKYPKYLGYLVYMTKCPKLIGHVNSQNKTYVYSKLAPSV